MFLTFSFHILKSVFAPIPSRSPRSFGADYFPYYIVPVFIGYGLKQACGFYPGLLYFPFFRYFHFWYA